MAVAPCSAGVGWKQQWAGQEFGKPNARYGVGKQACDSWELLGCHSILDPKSTTIFFCLSQVGFKLCFHAARNAGPYKPDEDLYNQFSPLLLIRVYI